MPISSAELPVQHICVGNRDANRLRTWIDATFEAVDTHEHKAVSGTSAVLLDTRCSFLLISGHDPKRLADIYRDFKVVLRNRIVVGAITDSTPRTRALMLRVGYDDVLDIEKTLPVEAIARFRAMWRRRCERIEIGLEQAKRSELFGQVCSNAALSAREVRLVECLLDRPGWCVPFERLQRVASRDEDPISIKNLRVSMSLLRRKLSAGTQIKAIPHEGYILTKANENIGTP